MTISIIIYYTISEMCSNSFFKIVKLCTVVCAGLLMITCEEPAQGPAQDSTPPELAAEIGTVEVSDNTISFTATNPNEELIKLSILLAPPAPNAVFMIGTETFAVGDGAEIPAGEVGNITITGLENGTTYALIISTEDSAGNSNDTPVTTPPVTPMQTFDYLCENGTASSERSPTANQMRCESCEDGRDLITDTTSGAITCEVTFPYLCVNGMPPAERSLTENQVRCGTCETDYDLVTDETTGVVTCERVYLFICNNGTATSGTSFTDGVMSCQGCIGGYALDTTDNTCYPVYICENGTPAPGRAPAPNTPGCSDCIGNYHVEDNICQPNRYVCPGGTEKVVGENETPPAVHETEFCTACGDGYRDGPNNTCLENLYTCTAGTGTAVTAVDGDRPATNGLENCATCVDFRHREEIGNTGRNSCEQNRYVCDGGTPSGGSPATHGDTSCSECDTSTHTLVGNVCRSNQYTCPGGTPTTGTPAMAGEVRCSACNTITHHPVGTLGEEGSACRVNEYSCTGGVERTGDIPRVHNTEYCTSCLAGYRPGPNNTCLPNLYMCENGTPVTPSGAFADGNRPATHNDVSRCMSCNAGNHPVGTLGDIGAICVENEYVCEGEGAGDPRTDNIPAVHETAGCSSCVFGYRLDNHACLENSYTCTVGTGTAVVATGGNRPATDGLENCATCVDFRHREEIGNTGRNSCERNRYVCEGGTPLVASPAVHGRIGCQPNSCDTTTRVYDNIQSTGDPDLGDGACRPKRYTCGAGEPVADGTPGDNADGTPRCAYCDDTYGLLSTERCMLLGTAHRVGTAANFGTTGTLGTTRIGDARGLGYCADTGILYMTARDTGFLYTLNRTNGQATKVGTFGVGFGLSSATNDNENEPVGLACRSNGTLYMVGDFRERLYTVDRNNGRASRIAATRFFGNNENNVSDISFVGSTLYMTGHTNDRLYQLSTMTGLVVVGSSVGVNDFGVSEGVPRALATSPDGVLYMVGANQDGLYTVQTATGNNYGKATKVGTQTRFGLSASDIDPSGLEFVGTTLYMVERQAYDALYEIAYDRDPHNRMQ